MADILLKIGTPQTGVPGLTDAKTGLPVTAVFTNLVVASNSNPEFATVAVDPTSGDPIATPVAAGSGTVVITADGAYTDPGDGSAKTGSFSVTKNFTVAPAADGVSFDVVFS